MSRTYLRGDLYYADLGHGIGSEQKGTRPIVIIQNNVGNKYSPPSLSPLSPARPTLTLYRLCHVCETALL